MHHAHSFGGGHRLFYHCHDLKLTDNFKKTEIKGKCSNWFDRGLSSNLSSDSELSSNSILVLTSQQTWKIRRVQIHNGADQSARLCPSFRRGSNVPWICLRGWRKGTQPQHRPLSADGWVLVQAIAALLAIFSRAGSQHGGGLRRTVYFKPGLLKRRPVGMTCSFSGGAASGCRIGAARHLCRACVAVAGHDQCAAVGRVSGRPTSNGAGRTAGVRSGVHMPAVAGGDCVQVSTEWNCFARKPDPWQKWVSSLPSKSCPVRLEGEAVWCYHVRVYSKIRASVARQYPYLKAIGFFPATEYVGVRAS